MRIKAECVVTSFEEDASIHVYTPGVWHTTLGNSQYMICVIVFYTLHKSRTEIHANQRQVPG
jgi:hypothetical protein